MRHFNMIQLVAAVAALTPLQQSSRPKVRHTKPDPKPTGETFEELTVKFHAHLEGCNQCRNHPFNLCNTGAGIMQQVAQVTPASP